MQYYSGIKKQSAASEIHLRFTRGRDSQELATLESEKAETGAKSCNKEPAIRPRLILIDPRIRLNRAPKLSRMNFDGCRRRSIQRSRRTRSSEPENPEADL